MSTRGERRKKMRSNYTRAMVVHDLLTRGIKVDASIVTVKSVTSLDHDDSHIHVFAPPIASVCSTPVAPRPLGTLRWGASREFCRTAAAHARSPFGGAI